jgi:hypothetical protein
MLKTDFIVPLLLVIGATLTITAEDFTTSLVGLGCVFYAVMVFIHGDDAL